jgi:hypothetical protein
MQVLSELSKVLIESGEAVLSGEGELIEPLLKALLHFFELVEHLIPELLEELVALNLHYPVIFGVQVSFQGLQ